MNMLCDDCLFRRIFVCSLMDSAVPLRTFQTLERVWGVFSKRWKFWGDFFQALEVK